VKEALRLGNLTSECGSRRALLLPSEGSHTHALLGGGCRGLGVLQGRSESAIGGRDGGGMRRQPAEEGGGGEGAGRRRNAVEGTVGVAGEECGTGTAKQEGTACAHCTDTGA
jgi:hypothetical protein